MSEAYTIGVTPNLVRHLLDDGKKVENKTRKPKPKINRQPQPSETLHSTKQLSNNSKTLSPTPDQKHSETLPSTKQISDNSKTLPPTPDQQHSETLHSTKQLSDISTTLPQTPDQKPAKAETLDAILPVLDRIEKDVKDVPSKCNDENTCKDPLKRTGLVDGFAECRRMFREKIGVLKEFLDRFRGN